ncbi:MAG: hypothetical protein EOM34_14080 [Clostridia bacterium]|nr:hypothetical protein [Clostridia bacterium]
MQSTLMRTINRFRICLSAMAKNKSTPCTTNKNIIIVFQQIFGDSVVIQDSLFGYTRIFPASKGYHVRFLARPSVLNFMKDNLVLPEEIEYEDVDFKRFLEDYHYFKIIVNKYMNTASTLIVPGTSLSAEVFSAANNAARKIGLVRFTDVTHPFIFKLFYNLAYTEKVRPEKDEMMLQRHRRLLNYLGDKEFQAKLPTAINQERIIKEQRYFVMCPGSSKMEKCWPIDRFAEVADYLIDTYGVNVHLCGGADEKHFEEELMVLVKHKTKVVSHIGSTTFAEWSSIVQYADLVIGNDSATMHLAAAHRRKSICIAGVYDKYQFFPYKVDILDEGDRLPVTVLKDMPCEYCRTIGYDAGYKNPECTKKIKNNQCALCIDAITVDEVIENIDKLMRE